uniref:Uncharacterized protein n=1 Tax=Magallana gigas TaxID=29159 RepID=A0A8W8KE30_MAGGI
MCLPVFMILYNTPEIRYKLLGFVHQKSFPFDAIGYLLPDTTMKFLLLAIIAVAAHGAPLDQIQQLPLKPGESRQQTEQSSLKEEELKPETKPSSRTADLRPEFAVEEDLKPETKPAQQIRSEQDAEEDLVPETRPVERRDLTDGEDEELVPQTKPVQRSSELKPETKPSPSQYVRRPTPEEFEPPKRRFVPRPVPLEEPKENQVEEITEE